MKKVLILDDQTDILDIWRENFRQWGLEVQIYEGTNGLLGLKQCKEVGKFDLVITDYKMPRMNGLDFIRELRAVDKTTPIFFFSGYIPELVFLVEDLENVMLFEKPFISDKFRAMIRMFLNDELRPVEAM